MQAQRYLKAHLRMPSLGVKVFSAAIWAVSLRFAVKSMALVNTIVLARVLVPEDFGLVAIVMAIYAFIQLLKNFGFDVVLIQKQNADDSHYDTAWTMQLLFGLLTGLVMLVAAPYIANYYEDYRLESISRAIALLFVLNGAVNIGVVNFRKDLNFQLEFRFRATVKFLSVIVTISLALYLRSYWALVIGTIVAAMLELVMSYYMSRYRPGLTLRAWRDLMGFSSWLLLNSFVQFFNRRLQFLVVGKLVGVDSVGFLTISNEFASLPNGELVAAVNRATFPGYSKVSDDKNGLRKLYLQALGGIVMIGIPGSVGVAVLAPLFVPVILGENWLAVIPLIHVLGLAFALVSINTNAGYVFHAIGKPMVVTLNNVFRASILISSMLVFINMYGLIGAVYSTALTALVMFPVYFILLNRAIGLRLAEYLGAIYRPVIASATMYLAVCQFAYDQPFVDPAAAETASIFLMFQVVALGAVVFAVSLGCLWLLAGRPAGAEKTSLELIRSRLQTSAGS